MAAVLRDFKTVPHDPESATKFILSYLINDICPFLQKIKCKMQALNKYDNEDEIVKLNNVFMLCSSQIKKCILNFLDVLKMEYVQKELLQQSRKFIFERLSCCISKLSTVHKQLEKCKLQENIHQDLSDDPIFATPMYFVNWIDYTFDVLAKIAENIYRTDYKDNDVLYEEWKLIMVEHVSTLHMCIDELLLSAMTLCKHCLPADQTILRARCQVVLRETKALFSELIIGDISATVKITTENLKLPIMPSNVNIMIDVLKDVLYVLETNTNNALLALLIHCYVACISPMNVLRDHFSKSNNKQCPCSTTSTIDIEECAIVKEFDLYNERLMQIGSFAVSCSSDEKRILTLRSCLSSLESLDLHLVPCVTTSTESYHTELLSKIWEQEVMEIRDTVFLIVDPIAFVEKCKEYMYTLLLEMRNQDNHENPDLWVVMNIAKLVYDFFAVYKKFEPEAIACPDLYKHLEQLNKALEECKTVSQFFIKDNVIDYDITVKIFGRELKFNNLVTRIKLLYSLIKRVQDLLRPKDNDEQLFGEEEVVKNKNITHTIRNNINTNTYTNSQRQSEVNFTRSMFSRTGNMRTSTKNMFLSKLTSHLKVKKGLQDELSFSAQVSELFNIEKEDRKYHKTSAGKISLRKAVLSNRFEVPFVRKLDTTFDIKLDNSAAKRGTYLEREQSLQISDILNQFDDLSFCFPTTEHCLNASSKNSTKSSTADEKFSTKLGSSKSSEGRWSQTSWTPVPPSIPILTQGTSTQDISSQNSSTQGTSIQDVSTQGSSTQDSSNATQPSSFTTLERINDLDLVESKIITLKSNIELETHL